MSTEPSTDSTSHLALVPPPFDDFNMELDNISTVFQNLVVIQNDLLENDKDLIEFMKNSTIARLDLSKLVIIVDHKVGFRLNEFKELIQDLIYFPLDRKYSSTMKIEEGCILYKEVIQRQKFLLCKLISITLSDFILPL